MNIQKKKIKITGTSHRNKCNIYIYVSDKMPLLATVLLFGSLGGTAMPTLFSYFLTVCVTKRQRQKDKQLPLAGSLPAHLLWLGLDQSKA